MNNLSKGCGVTIMTLGFIVYGTISIAFVMSIFWEWFILPLELGLPVFTIKDFIGINLFLSIVKPNYNNSNKSKGEFIDYVILVIFSPVLFLAIGWVYKSFL